MSQNDKPNLPTEDQITSDEETSVATDAGQASETVDTPEAQAEESTVGTGTSMALGCIAGTVVLILFGLLFLALRTMI